MLPLEILAPETKQEHDDSPTGWVIATIVASVALVFMAATLSGGF